MYGTVHHRGLARSHVSQTPYLGEVCSAVGVGRCCMC